MKKPDIKQTTQLIMEAPIGQYIGKDGAQILAECACCQVSLKDSEFLFHQGDLENSFYIVTEGRLSLVKERKKGKEPQVLHVLEKGDLVGELSFIDDTPHIESCMAIGDASVLRFKADDFRPLITEHPRLMFDFMRAIIKRAHHTVSSIEKQQMALSDYISTGGKGRQ
jgi:CRP-like cAMP-binding protein